MFSSPGGAGWSATSTGGLPAYPSDGLDTQSIFNPVRVYGPTGILLSTGASFDKTMTNITVEAPDADFNPTRNGCVVVSTAACLAIHPSCVCDFPICSAAHGYVTCVD